MRSIDTWKAAWLEQWPTAGSDQGSSTVLGRTGPIPVHSSSDCSKEGRGELEERQGSLWT